MGQHIRVDLLEYHQSIKKNATMKYLVKTFFLTGAILLASCSSQQSLQEYYVDNSENPNFIALDVPASILKLNEESLSSSQKEAVESLRKFNMLAFKKTADNVAEYRAEKAKVKEILKDHSVTLDNPGNDHLFGPTFDETLA